MVKLFDPSTRERPIPQLIGGGARLQPVSPSGGEGQGLRALGQALEAGADDILQAQRVEEERVNTLRAEEAFNRLRETQLDLTVGDKNGFSNLKGADAVTRPILQEWGKRFDDAERDISAGLANDTQRQKFKRRADVARLQFKEGVLRHMATESDTYAKQVYDGVVSTEQQNAVARWDSPNDVGLSLTRITNAVDERAERYGWQKDYRDIVLRQEHSKVHAAVVQQSIASGNYTYAKEWYDQYRDDIDPTTAKQLAVAVENGTQKELTNAYNSDYLANENSPPALESLRTKVLGDDTLAEDRKNILVGRIQNRQYTLERRNEIETSKRLRVIERGISDLNSNTLAGFEPSAEQFQSLLDAAKGTELEGEVRRAIQLADATRSFRHSAPLVQEKLLTEAEAGIRTHPTKFDRRVVEAWRSIYDHQRKQVQEAPVAFAIRQGLIETPTPVDLADPVNAGPALAERFAISRSVAARYQAPIKPLTPEEVSILRGTLDRANPAQQRDYFAKLYLASGNDTAGYMAIMSQLAPDDPVTAIAGSVAALGRTQAADYMLRGQRIINPSKGTDGKPDGALLPMPAENEMRSAFDRHVQEVFSGRAEQRNAHYQATKAIYAAMSLDAGDKDTKVFDANRWEQAMEQAIGAIEKYQGRRVILPTGVEYSQFRDGVRDRIDQLLQGSREAAARLAAVEKAPNEKRIEQLAIINKSGSYLLDKGWTADRLRELPLESVGNGRYVFRSGDGVLVDRSGRPVVIDFNRPVLKQSSADAFEDAEGGLIQRTNTQSSLFR